MTKDSHISETAVRSEVCLLFSQKIGLLMKEGDSSPLNKMLVYGIIPLHAYCLGALMKGTSHVLALPLTAEEAHEAISNLLGTEGVCRFTQTCAKQRSKYVLHE